MKPRIPAAPHRRAGIAVSLAIAAAIASLAFAPQAHADATLDRIKQRGKLVVGIDGVSPPFGIMDPATGKVGGFQAELGEDIARRLGVKLETVSVTASTRVQFLQSGKVDLLVANIQWTRERSASLSYAPTPYNEVGGAALVSRQSGITRWEDLKGKVACVSQGSNYAEPLDKTYGAVVKGLRGIPESLLALKGGTCAASVHVQPALYELLHGPHAKEWEGYTLATSDLLIPSPTVIWTRRNEADTRAFVDGVIHDWLKSGYLLAQAGKFGVPDDYIRKATDKARQGSFDKAPLEIQEN
ncbi:transporter substrate-binding domain-containing protein [Achromobacter aloeverae]